MNPRLARLLVYLYPRPWKQRYGAEFDVLLQAGPGSFRTITNVVWSALCERISPTPGLKMNQDCSPFQSLCIRAPWAMFGLAPLLILATAYFVACFILWSGWAIFLPGTNTPFGGGPLPLYSFENFYFQAGRALYFGAPILIGWGIGLIAARYRVKAVWPSIGLILIAFISTAARVRASRPLAGGAGHVSMDFILGHSVQEVSSGLFHALAVFSLTIVPYLIWRLLKARSAPA